MNFIEWMELDESSAGTTFKTWYDYHRGKWSDVESLAARSPKLRAFLDRIDNEVQYGKFDKFANTLQRYVSKHVPGHAKYEMDPQKRYQNMVNQGRNLPPRGAQLGSGTVPSGATASMQGAAPSNQNTTHAWSSNQGQGATQQDPTMVMRNHEERLAALERLFQQFQSGQYQRQSS
jgi:hypothetical protein